VKVTVLATVPTLGQRSVTVMADTLTDALAKARDSVFGRVATELRIVHRRRYIARCTRPSNTAAWGGDWFPSPVMCLPFEIG
jgi:hypothetical protein